MAVMLKELSRLLKKSSVLIMLLISPFLVAGIALLFYINYDSFNMKVGVLNLDKDERSVISLNFLLRFFKGVYIEKVRERDYIDKLLKGELDAVLVIPEGFMEKVYSREKSEVWYIPSPHDLQISIGAYTALRSVLKDLSGGIFVDVGAMEGSCIRKMLFSYKSYPPPGLHAKRPRIGGFFPPPSAVLYEPPNSRPISFDVLLSPAVILLSGVLAALTLSIHSVIDDEERRLIWIYKTRGLNPVGYAASIVLVYSLVGVLTSSIAYIIDFLMTGTVIPVHIRIPLMFLVSVFYSSLGFVISSFSPNRSSSTLLMVVFAGASFFASGNLITVRSVPEFARGLIESSMIYNANMVLRKVLIFPGVDVHAEMAKVLVWTVGVFSAALVSGYWALRRC